MPHAATQPPPFGGPPAMPGSANPSIFDQRRGASLTASRGEDAEQKVLVDLGLHADPKKLDAELKALKAKLERANASYEREVLGAERA